MDRALTPVACPSCGAAINGAFCASCGQRAPAPDDFTSKRFLRAAWREMSDSDSRSLATLRAMFRPGELTRAFLAREWRRYLPPLRLYLVLSALFFLVGWGPYFDLQMASLRAAPPEQLPPGMAEVLANPDLAAASSDWTALFRVAAVLLMALWLALLNLDKRQPLGAHLVFATHYYGFDYLFFSITGPLVALLPDATRPVAAGLIVPFGLLVLFTWMLLAVRRVFDRGWPAATVHAVAVLVVDVVLSSLSGVLGLSVAVALMAR